MRFEAGQKVLCIGMDPQYVYKLTIGKLYVISNPYPKVVYPLIDWIYVEDSPVGYSAEYFVPFGGTEFEKIMWGLDND